MQNKPLVLFLCTGNYYRSRFAEFYFRHLAEQHSLPWWADSRGLALDARNPGAMSVYTRRECQKRSILAEPSRLPLPIQREDLAAAQLIVAVKEAEHRAMVRRWFPEWEQRVEYWDIHDIDVHGPEIALPLLAAKVEALVDRLLTEHRAAFC